MQTIAYSVTTTKQKGDGPLANGLVRGVPQGHMKESSQSVQYPWYCTFKVQYNVQWCRIIARWRRVADDSPRVQLMHSHSPPCRNSYSRGGCLPVRIQNSQYCSVNILYNGTVLFRAVFPEDRPCREERQKVKVALRETDALRPCQLNQKQSLLQLDCKMRHSLELTSAFSFFALKYPYSTKWVSLISVPPCHE